MLRVATVLRYTVKSIAAEPVEDADVSCQCVRQRHRAASAVLSRATDPRTGRRRRVGMGSESSALSHDSADGAETTFTETGQRWSRWRRSFACPFRTITTPRAS